MLLLPQYHSNTANQLSAVKAHSKSDHSHDLALDIHGNSPCQRESLLGLIELNISVMFYSVDQFSH